ncbi:MAG: tetratricopeptide repeat protein, partial [Ktedonobacteraceae bacterium]
RALSNGEKAFGQEHRSVAVGLDTLARLRRAQGLLVEAAALAVRALTIFQKIGGNDNYVASSLNTLAEIYYEQKSYSQVEKLLQQALQIQEQTLGPEHPQTARSLYNLALLAVTPQEDYHKAAGYCARALAILQQARLPQHPDLIAVSQHNAEILQKIKHMSEPPFLEEMSEAAHTTEIVVSLDRLQLLSAYDY